MSVPTECVASPFLRGGCDCTNCRPPPSPPPAISHPIRRLVRAARLIGSEVIMGRARRELERARYELEALESALPRRLVGEEMNAIKSGTCPACDRPIKVGDRIVYRRPRLAVHTACVRWTP